jgi:sulfite reductase (NADPH) flavoprotein alpha-component
LEKGAHLYVCGDARKMAKDLRKSLIRVVQEASGSDEQQAAQYVKNLVKTGRYQEDVY